MPDIQCLYLDMNEIIWTVMEPLDLKNTLETDVFIDIFHRIEHLVNIVRPQHYLFLASDGVVPMAKKNLHKHKKLLTKENGTTEFVHNSDNESLFGISYNSRFMDALQTELGNFISFKIHNDPLWTSIKVLQSGNRVPGEGEHKIAEFLRYRRTIEGYNPNTSHCIYGLDADIVMVALASHEPNIYIMKNVNLELDERREYNLDDLRFTLSSIPTLREYIEKEFDTLKSKLGAEFNLEALIDDWVFMTYFLGNDFVPPAVFCGKPAVALPLLWKVYETVRCQMGKYINEGGLLEVDALIEFSRKATFFDTEYVKRQFLGKRSHFRKSTEKYKEYYYHNHIGQLVNSVSEKEKCQFVTQYVEILQWINFYYYYGVPSYENYHTNKRAPFISDLALVDALVINEGFTFHYETFIKDPRSDERVMLYEYDKAVVDLRADIFRLPFVELMPFLLPGVKLSDHGSLAPICGDAPSRNRNKSFGTRQRISSNSSCSSDFENVFQSMEMLHITDPYSYSNGYSEYDPVQQDDNGQIPRRVRHNSNDLRKSRLAAKQVQNKVPKSRLWNESSKPN